MPAAIGIQDSRQINLQDYPSTNSYAPAHGKPILGLAPEAWDEEWSNALYKNHPLLREYAPVAPGSYGSSAAAPSEGPYSYAVRSEEKLPDGDSGAFGAFEGAGPHTITFTSTKNCFAQTDYEFKKGDQPFLTGQTTLMNAFSRLCTGLECLGFLEPFHRNWQISTLNKETVFSFEITPGWLDSQIHAVKNAEGIEIGRIQQPSFVQRVSDMWRQQLQVVVRVLDSKGYERFSLRRHGGCGQTFCPYFKKFLPEANDLCYGRWNFNLAQWVDCDFSRYDCGNCNNLCGQAQQQPCFKLCSCRQCCEYRECDVCFENPGEICCECNWYHCDIVGADQLKCMYCPLCPGDCAQCPAIQPGQAGCCFPHNPYCNITNTCAQDCSCCGKPEADFYAVCLTCNCFRGCEFKCCTVNFQCCKFTDCPTNWINCIKYQCLECIRLFWDCPDCATKCKTFYSKCVPQCKREWNFLCECCKQIVPCIKNCITRCPHRMRQLFCGGRDVRIELDVYGPDGDDNVPVSKIVYTGTSGWCCGMATLRPKYEATIQIPSVSPYYARWKNEQRGVDYVDLALLTSLAIWYDFFCVAPREWFQCADPITPEGNELWPEGALHEYWINPPLPGTKNSKEPIVIMTFKWLYGEDFAFLLDPELWKDRFTFIQDNPAGTLPIKQALPTSRSAEPVAASSAPASSAASVSSEPAVAPVSAEPVAAPAASEEAAPASSEAASE